MLESYRPRLHAGIYPRVKPGHGPLTYLYQDDLGGRYHEFEPEQHQVIQLMDGTRTLTEIAQEASTLLDAEVPPEFIDVFVSNLENANLLSLGSCRSIDPQRQQNLIEHLRRQLKKRYYTLEEWAQKPPESAEIDELLFHDALTKILEGDACEGARLLEGLLEISPKHKRGKFVLRTLEKQYIAPLSEGDSLWFFRVPLGDPDRLLGFLNRTAGKVIFTPYFAATWLAVVISGAVIALTEFDRLFAGIEKFASFDWMLNQPWLFLLVMGIARAMLITHEFAHGLTCKHYGGPVRRMGLLFAYFNPGAYCDVTSLYLCEKKWQRALVGLAGVCSDLFFASILAIVFYIFREDAALAQAAPPIMVVTFFGFFNNLNPILRNDGSIVLTELLGNSSFRTEAFDYIKRRAHAYFEGSQMQHRAHFRVALNETIRMTVTKAKMPEAEGLVAEAQSIDVSAGGIQLASIISLFPGDRVRVEFNLANGDHEKAVDVEGTVRRCLPLDGERFSMGIQFDHAIAVESLENDEKFRTQYLTFGILGGALNVVLIGTSLWFMTHLALTQWGAFGVFFVTYIWSNILLRPMWGGLKYVWKHRRDIWASPRSRRLVISVLMLIVIAASLPAKRTVEGTFQLVYPEVATHMPYNGRVTEVLAHTGQQVQKGQPLLRVDSSALELALAKKKAELHQMQLAFDLLTKGPLPQQLLIERARLQAANVRSQFDEKRRLRISELPNGVAREVDWYHINADLAAYETNAQVAKAQLRLLEALPRQEQRLILEEQLRTLQAETAQLQKQITRSTVLASDSGILVKAPATLESDGFGLFFQEGTELFRIRPAGYPVLRASFSSQQKLESLERGLSAEAKLVGAPEETIVGRVQSISVAASDPTANAHKTKPSSKASGPRDILATIEVSQGMEIGQWPSGLSGHVRIDAGWVPRAAILYEDVSLLISTVFRRLFAT